MQRSSVSSIFPASDRYCPRHTVSVSQRDLCRLSLVRFLDISRIRVRLDERITSADGTQLSIDLYLPPEPGRYPVLLHRTASDNNRLPRITGSLQMLPGAADRWKAYAA